MRPSQKRKEKERDISLITARTCRKFFIVLLAIQCYVFILLSAVRFGRVPKREKAKIMAAMQNSRMKTQESRVMGVEMSDDGKIVETIVRAHYDTCDYTRNKMEPFVVKAKASPSFAVCSGQVSQLRPFCAMQ